MWQLIQKIVRMMVDKPLQNQFFSVLYSITSSKPQSPFLTYFVLLAYIFQLILCYFAITEPSNTLSAGITSTSAVGLVVFSLAAAIMVQLAIAFVYRQHLQLLFQLMMYRYILFPLALILLVSEIDQPRYTSPLLAAILMLLIACLAYFVNFIIHCYSSTHIDRTFERVSGNLVLTDLLLMLTKLPSSFVYLEGAAASVLFLHLLTRHQLVRYRLANGREQIEYYSMMLKDLFVAIYLSEKADIIGGDSIVMLLLVTPLLIAGLVKEFTRKRSVILRREVFTAEAPMTDFLLVIEAIGTELARFKSNQDLEMQGSLLLVFMALHKGRCRNTSCLLLQRSTEEEIRNCNQSNNMKILKHKIVKKLEYLFELYERTHSDHTHLKLHLIAFYIHHLPNKLKIAHLVSTIRTLPLNWHQRLVFFGLLRRVDQIEVVEELMEASKSEDEFLEFKKQMSNAVTCFQELWGQLTEERVDVNQLIAISSKLFPLKKIIEQAWRRHLNQEKFSSWNILRTYIYYRRNVLHDFTNSVILEDYCKIVEQRLKAKHQMSYINSETEQAVLAISLTESSLGNIASMNSQSCKMFNFPSKEEMLELRVNDIMPSVYSILHDNILSSFLKNRFKNINQDLRFVFGKNKNGFIFPFLLQLRKLSWNLNDQLIFIAHLEPARLRSAPIYCITDLQGDIQDYTSTFAWLFMKKGRDNAQIKRKNIQEMLPSFFETLDGAAAQGKANFHERTYSHKNGQNIEVQFTASQLYIKAEKVGYLVEGSNTQTMATFKESNSISGALDNFYKENNIFVNTYSPKTLAYQIPNQTQVANKLTKQFTIPFLKTSDIQGILNLNQNKPIYDKGIKTLRLLHGRLEHMVEDDSFHSDEDSFEMKEISIIKKMQKMKEQLLVEENSNIGDYFKKIVLFITLLFTLLLLFIISSNSTFENRQTLSYEDKLYKLKIKQLLPEYLIYTLRQMPLKDAIRDELKNNVMQSSIQEYQKQNILKAVFSSPISPSLQLDPQLLTFAYPQIHGYESILSLWYLSAVASFLYLLTLFFIYVYFKFKIYNIYLIFLSISESRLLEMQEDAKQLVEYLGAQNIQYFKVAPLHNQKREETEEAEFSRLKKMKNDYTIEDLASITQLTLPVLLILCYSIFCSVFIQANIANYEGYMNAWLDCSELMPSTSISLFNSYASSQLINTSFPSSFSSMEEQFQFIVLLKGIDSGNLLGLMQGDPCTNISIYQQLPVNLSQLCSNSTSYLQYSLINVLNYMSAIIQTSNLTVQSDWQQLIKLQYQYVKPVLSYISIFLGDELDMMRHSCESNAIILGIVFVSLLIMAAAYIICYPLNDIYQKMLFTTDLIKVLPSERESEPEHALAAMTTEAMETY